ncbi:MAG: transcription elongation factor GreA [Pelolinea sp.]|nr:transcription elongation factor GreA [Pelolinea sp.]
MTTTFLTKEGFDELQAELDQLRKVKRLEIANRLREAADGEDLIENAEFEAAKNEQAFVEGKILDLESLLASAKIISEAAPGDSVQVGSKVVFQEEGCDTHETYVIVGAAEAKPNEGRISNESPLGKSLIGHKKGDMATVDAPDGKFNVKIIKVS